ncbi:hypothetical protein DFJ69_2538 [Thermomonospora umbrina]|uniref:Uncharacterized protein n=1 Tax=Thermomonospora umbrina TaxID=111806 RepID=A0A3D9SMD2_9ACTN|nr:hypothetical protein DFJ69_2538 [Thermomonospora umbrina]
MPFVCRRGVGTSRSADVRRRVNVWVSAVASPCGCRTPCGCRAMPSRRRVVSVSRRVGTGRRAGSPQPSRCLPTRRGVGVGRSADVYRRVASTCGCLRSLRRVGVGRRAGSPQSCRCLPTRHGVGVGHRAGVYRCVNVWVSAVASPGGCRCQWLRRVAVPMSAVVPAPVTVPMSATVSYRLPCRCRPPCRAGCRVGAGRRAVASPCRYRRRVLSSGRLFPLVAWFEPHGACTLSPPTAVTASVAAAMPLSAVVSPCRCRSSRAFPVGSSVWWRGLRWSYPLPACSHVGASRVSWASVELR